MLLLLLKDVFVFLLQPVRDLIDSVALGQLLWPRMNKMGTFRLLIHLMLAMKGIPSIILLSIS